MDGGQRLMQQPVKWLQNNACHDKLKMIGKPLPIIFKQRW